MKTRFLRTTIALLAITAFLALGAFAQSTEDSKFNVYVGAEFRDVYTNPGSHAPGWEVSGTYNFTPILGVTADFDGFYNNFQPKNFNPINVSSYTYLFGPQLTLLHINNVTGYVHALVGASHARGSAFSSDALSYAFGGGIDIPVSKRLSIRPVQLDYVTANYNTKVNTLRYSGGLVFKF